MTRTFAFVRSATCVTATFVALTGFAAIDLSAIPEPRIIKGDGNTAFRDPAIHYENGTFHLFFTWAYAYPGDCTIGYSTSQDLVHWSPPREILPRKRLLNYSSPGNMIRVGDDRVLCMQTYPTPHGKPGEVVYANDTARIFTIRTSDFKTWTEPEILRVKGPNVPIADMGRMIDAYIIKDDGGLWHCFYKQNGVSFSTSRDLKTWTYVGRSEAGENTCVIKDDDGEWVMFHSPRNGIGVKRSRDLVHWRDVGMLTLGQKEWTWAKGRITAGTVIDGRKIPGVGKYLMIFHGSGPRTENEGDNWRNASLAIAWSDNLLDWEWPGCKAPAHVGK